MLPRTNRMRRSTDFRRAVRRGARTASATLVVHSIAEPVGADALIGLVVSRSVGNAVVRNRVKRRLRDAVRPHLERLGPLLVVIRAKPAAASADLALLSRDLDWCLSRIAGVSC